MGQVDEVLRMFAGQPFGPPCSEEDIREAERALGEPLPAALRELYLAFDGFEYTYASFLMPLLRRKGMVWHNLHYRDDAASQDDPAFRAFISQCLFFGYDGCGGYWGV